MDQVRSQSFEGNPPWFLQSARRALRSLLYSQSILYRIDRPLPSESFLGLVTFNKNKMEEMKMTTNPADDDVVMQEEGASTHTDQQVSTL